jgi:hypothetical protein
MQAPVQVLKRGADKRSFRIKGLGMTLSVQEARQRAKTYMTIGWALSLVAMALFAAAIPHALYAWSLSWYPGHLAKLAADLSALNDAVVALPGIGWVWSSLPDPTEDLISELLLSPVICTAVAFALVGVYLRKEAARLREAIAPYREPLVAGPTQSIGAVHAGGNVNIHQVVNEKPRDKPLRVALISGAITVAVNLIGALVRHFLG